MVHEHQPMLIREGRVRPHEREFFQSGAAGKSSAWLPCIILVGSTSWTLSPLLQCLLQTGFYLSLLPSSRLRGPKIDDLMPRVFPSLNYLTTYLHLASSPQTTIATGQAFGFRHHLSSACARIRQGCQACSDGARSSMHPRWCGSRKVSKSQDVAVRLRCIQHFTSSQYFTNRQRDRHGTSVSSLSAACCVHVHS